MKFPELAMWIAVLFLNQRPGDATVSEDLLIYIDEECMKNMQTSSLKAELCDDTFLFNGSVRRSFSPLYELNVYRPLGSDIWTASHSWSTYGNGDKRFRRFMYKVKFRSTFYSIRHEKDHLCVQFKTLGDDPVPPQRRAFPCLRILPGEVAQLYILEGGKNKYDKHQINTECQCPNQKPSAHLVGQDLLAVEFKREPRTSGYQVQILDRETRNEIDKSGVMSINVSQESVVFERFIREPPSNLVVKVKFWCTNYINKAALDKICREVTINISDPSSPSSSKDSEKSSQEFFKENIAMKVAIVAIVLLCVVTSASVTVVIYKRRNRFSGPCCRTSGEAQTQSPRTNYFPVSPDPGYVQSRSCVILYQPYDDNTTGDGVTSESSVMMDLERNVEAKGVHVCTYPCGLRKSQEAIENWCSASEKIVNDYDDIIFVASFNFNLLWSTYQSNDELQKLQHQSLLKRRRQENIPCSVLNMLREKTSSRQSIKPKIYIASLNCTDTLSQVPIFFTNAPFLLSNATVYCLGCRQNSNCNGHIIKNRLRAFNSTNFYEQF